MSETRRKDPRVFYAGIAEEAFNHLKVPLGHLAPLLLPLAPLQALLVELKEEPVELLVLAHEVEHRPDQHPEPLLGAIGFFHDLPELPLPLGEVVEENGLSELVLEVVEKPSL